MGFIMRAMNNFLYKIKQLFLLTVIFTCIILSITYLNRNPLYLKERFYEKINYKTEYQYPGSFVSFIHPYPSNNSYCNFNYGLPQELKFNVSDIAFSPEKGRNGTYRVLYNIIEAMYLSDVPGVTYATHISADFTSYVAELARLWEGPISIAAFAPYTDVDPILEILHQLCYCLPDMSRVSVHLAFNKQLPPYFTKDNLTKPTNCIIPNSEKITTMRSEIKVLEYPINVCRNIARVSADTNYILVSDIQLLPSEELASRFMRLVENLRITITKNSKIVFVLPVFEVESYMQVPKTKTALLTLLKSERSVYFHRLVCSHCQKFPGIERWVDTEPGNNIIPFSTTKREIPYQRWEPIYIGSHFEPFYDENLSWEGLQDKMLQMLEMCLLDYKFIILDGAFLVHWPGIKKTKNAEERWRVKFEIENARQYNITLNSFLRKYKNNPKCQLQ